MHSPLYYRENAARFRELASDSDARTAASLIQLAEEYEAEALRLEPEPEPEPGPPLPAAS
jgi:hypothetical protein